MRPGRKKSVKKVIPDWDAGEQTLFWRGRPVHHFSKEAPDQVEILEAFQTAGWPHCLNKSRLAGKAIQTKKQLHDTIDNLNRSQGVLHFYQEGSGSRICWKPAK